MCHYHNKWRKITHICLFETKHLQILKFKHPVFSQRQWFNQLTKLIETTLVVLNALRVKRFHLFHAFKGDWKLYIYIDFVLFVKYKYLLCSFLSRPHLLCIYKLGMSGSAQFCGESTWPFVFWNVQDLLIKLPFFIRHVATMAFPIENT